MPRRHLDLVLALLLLPACASDPVELGAREQAALPTPALESWGPGTAATTTFMRAAACHRRTEDEYGIAAVFRRTSLERASSWEELYYLRVRGDDTRPDFGQLIQAIKLDQATTIPHVDCAEDDGSAIFVAYGRQNQAARWVRYDGTGVSAAHDLTGCETGEPHAPRIATRGGKVVVLYDGYQQATGVRSCGICWEVFTTAGAHLRSGNFWPEGMTHRDFDLEWAHDRYIVGLKFKFDGEATCRYSTFQLDEHGIAPVPLVRNDVRTSDCHGDLDDASLPKGLQLVYSPTFWSYFRHSILQTDRETYYLHPDGRLHTRIAGYGGPYDHRPSCEYWGDQPRIAHTFVEDTLNLRSTHAHWSWTPAAPTEIGGVTPGYYPEACSVRTASGVNSELLLVARATVSSSKVYWGTGPQH